MILGVKALFEFDCDFQLRLLASMLILKATFNNCNAAARLGAPVPPKWDEHMLRTTLTTGLSLLLLSTVGVTGCGDGGSADPTGTGGTGASSGPGGDGGTGGATGGSGGTGGMTPPGDVYELESKFAPGQSAISYSGQTFRHALIESMKSYVGTLTMAIDGAGNPPQTQAEMVSALMYYHDFDRNQSHHIFPLVRKLKHLTVGELVHFVLNDLTGNGSHNSATFAKVIADLSTGRLKVGEAPAAETV